MRRPIVDGIAEAVGIRRNTASYVDGADLDQSQKNFYVRSIFLPRYPFRLRDTEIAVFLSHRACWKKILDLKLDSALIFEDDVIVDRDVFLPNFELSTNCALDGDYVRFPVKRQEKPRCMIAKHGDKEVFVPKTVGLGCQAQLVTSGAAKLLLESTDRFDRPVDTFIQMTWAHGARVLTVNRAGVKETSKSIGGSLVHRGSTGPKLGREIKRAVYRIKVSVRSRINKAA